MDDIERVNADMGGTEILNPLEHVFKMKKRGNRKFIFLLTDGQVSNTY